MKRSPLKAGSGKLKQGTGLKRTTPLKTKTSLVRATFAAPIARVPGVVTDPTPTALARPPYTATRTRKATLTANPARMREAKHFHDEVFAAFGLQCVLCARPHPAHVAAHVIKRSELGKLRYADVRFARPAHDDCHMRQEANEIYFAAAIVASAIEAYNALTRCKTKLLLPG